MRKEVVSNTFFCRSLDDLTANNVVWNYWNAFKSIFFVINCIHQCIYYEMNVGKFVRPLQSDACACNLIQNWLWLRNSKSKRREEKRLHTIYLAAPEDIAYMYFFYNVHSIWYNLTRLQSHWKPTTWLEIN